jgi:hypothetical protein
MSQNILCYGIPPLTEDAADAALDMIHFIAAAVRGYDAIEINDVVRPLWRAHVAELFPQLPFVTRNWYANAPNMLAAIGAQWQLLNPWQQAALVQQWTIELPGMLWMLEPVLAQAHTAEISDSVRAMIAGLRQTAAQAQPAIPQAPVVSQPVESQPVVFQPVQSPVVQPLPIPPQPVPPSPVQELNRRMDMAAQLASFSTRMNNLTITQMHAMSGT